MNHTDRLHPYHIATVYHPPNFFLFICLSFSSSQKKKKKPWISILLLIISNKDISYGFRIPRLSNFYVLADAKNCIERVKNVLTLVKVK